MLQVKNAEIPGPRQPANHYKLAWFNRSPFFLGYVYKPLLISDLNPSPRGVRGEAYLCFKTLRR